MAKTIASQIGSGGRIKAVRFGFAQGLFGWIAALAAPRQIQKRDEAGEQDQRRNSREPAKNNADPNGRRCRQRQDDPVALQGALVDRDGADQHNNPEDQQNIGDV
jgi:hypothetical protein